MLSIKLKWTDRSTSEEGHRIYRSFEPIDINNLPEPIATLPANTQEYEDSDIIAGVVYHYLISAYKGSIEKFGEPIVARTDLPVTGPGPQELVGHNETAGYFGRIPSTELISGAELTLDMGVFSKADNNVFNWMKFVLDGKVLLIPDKCLVTTSSCTWLSLYNRNVVFGDRTVFIKGYEFKVRLLTGLSPEFDGDVAPGNDPESTWGSEWNRLMYNVSSQASKPSQVGDDWAQYSYSELGTVGSGMSTVSTWCQERIGDKAVNRANNNLITAMSLHDVDSTRLNYSGWRPVLELITS